MSVERRYTTNRITHCPHDLIYVCSKDYFKQNEETQPVHFELPYPVHDPYFIGEEDVVQSIILHKKMYTDAKEHAAPYVCATKEVLANCKSHDELSVGILNLYVTPDPDVYFNCDYNFYYTGGCLEYITFGGKEDFVRPNYNNELCAYDFSTAKDCVINYRASSPILNLRVGYTHDKILFTVREKNKISIISTKDMLNSRFKTKWSLNSPDIPFLDAKGNGPNTDIMATVKANFSLDIHDTKCREILRSFDKSTCRSTIDCFSQIEFWNRNNLIFANRGSLKLFDIRSNKCKDELGMNLEPCNIVCCFNIFEDSIYVATRHDLCRYDLRNLRQACEFSSHFLSFAPCYMDIAECYDDTFITLSAQNINQKVIFGTKSINKLPARMPSLLDTLRQSKLRKDLLLRDNLEELLNESVTGIKLIENENTKFLVSTNCKGQLFQQKICSTPFDVAEPIDMLYNWLNKFPKHKQPYEAKRVVDMTKLFQKMVKVDDNIDSKFPKRENKRDEFIKKFSAIYNKDNGCDLMHELMSIWEVDNEPENMTTAEDMHSKSKVASWIETQAFENDEDSS